jgi:hypothetical protein
VGSGSHNNFRKYFDIESGKKFKFAVSEILIRVQGSFNDSSFPQDRFKTKTHTHTYMMNVQMWKMKLAWKTHIIDTRVWKVNERKEIRVIVNC